MGPLGRVSLTLEAASPQEAQFFLVRLQFYRRTRTGLTPSRGTRPTTPLLPFQGMALTRVWCRRVPGPASLPFPSSLAPPRPASTASASAAGDDFAVVSHVALHPMAPSAHKDKSAKRVNPAQQHWTRPAALLRYHGHVNRFRELKVRGSERGAGERGQGRGSAGRGRGGG